MLEVLALALAAPACVATDGDTIRCGAYSVRIAGINTADDPGSRYCRTGRALWCNRAMSRAATKAMRRWLAKGPYVLKLTGRCDRYGRRLGTAIRGTEDVRDVLLAQGVARPDRRKFSDRRCG